MEDHYLLERKTVTYYNGTPLLTRTELRYLLEYKIFATEKLSDGYFVWYNWFDE